MILDAPSPNHGARRGGARPDIVVLHYTEMATAEAALARLRDPAAEVSAHYVVAEDGRVWRLVDETRRAWHAGAGGWGGVWDVNSRSTGIELANTGAAPYPEPQMAALEALLAPMLARWSIPPERVIGHACLAPERKVDPGPRFDWRRLARRGLAVWLDAPVVAERDREGGRCPGLESGPLTNGGGPGSRPGQRETCERLAARSVADPAAFRRAARRFGYPVAAEGGWDRPALAAARAFRDRFRPWERMGEAPLSQASLAHLEALAARWPVAAEPEAA